MKRLFAALLLVPLADALLLAYVASAVLTWELTIALVVVTALLGTLFVRSEGRHTLRRIQESLRRGEPPTDELVDGGLLVAAGAFLLTPGFVTDALGFLLVIPFTRAPIRNLLKDRYVVPYLDEQTGGFASGNVYTFGFPGGTDGPDAAGADATGPGPSWGASGPDGAAGASEDTVDVGDDAYEIDFDDEDEPDGQSA